MKLINKTNEIPQEEVEKWKALLHTEKFTSNNGDCWQTSQSIWCWISDWKLDEAGGPIQFSFDCMEVLEKPFEKIKTYGEIHYSL